MITEAGTHAVAAAVSAVVETINATVSHARRVVVQTVPVRDALPVFAVLVASLPAADPPEADCP